MTKAITKKNNEAINIQSALLDIVQRTDIDPERLERFLEIQIRLEDRQAEAAFYASLASFQAECPAVIKSKAVTNNSGKHMYNYAELDEMVETIRPHLAKNGLSFSFNINKGEGDMSELITRVMHKNGHSSVSSYFYNPMADGGAMNSSQRVKSALTYAKRAGLESALGLITANQDDDAKRAVNKKAPDEILKEFKELLSVATEKSISMDMGALVNNLKIESIEDIDSASEEDLKRILPLLKKKVSNV